MSCQCYQIGGPFISFDPDCPAHGLEAQKRESEAEQQAQRETEMTQRIAELEQTVQQLRNQVRAL